MLRSTFARLLRVAFVLASCVLLFRVAAAAGDHLLYVSNERAGTVSVIESRTGAVKSTWPVGKRPRGIHLSPDGATLYVAVSGSPRLGPGADPERAKNLKADKSADGIAVLDAASGKLLRKLSVGSDPEEFALSADGRRVIVSNEDEAQASSWKIASGERVFVTKVSDEPEGVSVNPAGSEVYVTCEEKGEVFVLDAATGAVRERFAVAGRPRTVAFRRDGTRAYVPSEGESFVAVVDATAHRVLQSIRVDVPGARPMGTVLSPDDRELFVSLGRGNAVAVIDTRAEKMVAAIPVGERAWGIALSPDGARLYTANGGTNDVSVVDVRARKEVARIPVGDGPWGIAVRPAR